QIGIPNAARPGDLGASPIPNHTITSFAQLTFSAFSILSDTCTHGDSVPMGLYLSTETAGDGGRTAGAWLFFCGRILASRGILRKTTSRWLLISCRNSQGREPPASNTEESVRNPIGNRFRVAASFAAAVLYHHSGHWWSRKLACVSPLRLSEMRDQVG